MLPTEDGRLFNESIEQGITSLVDRIHYSDVTNRKHAFDISMCVECGDLYGKIRRTLAGAIL